MSIHIVMNKLTAIGKENDGQGKAMLDFKNVWIKCIEHWKWLRPQGKSDIIERSVGTILVGLRCGGSSFETLLWNKYRTTDDLYAALGNPGLKGRIKIY